MQLWHHEVLQRFTKIHVKCHLNWQRMTKDAGVSRFFTHTYTATFDLPSSNGSQLTKRTAQKHTIWLLDTLQPWGEIGSHQQIAYLCTLLVALGRRSAIGLVTGQKAWNNGLSNERVHRQIHENEFQIKILKGIIVSKISPSHVTEFDSSDTDTELLKAPSWQTWISSGFLY